MAKQRPIGMRLVLTVRVGVPPQPIPAVPHPLTSVHVVPLPMKPNGSRAVRTSLATRRTVVSGVIMRGPYRRGRTRTWCALLEHAMRVTAVLGETWVPSDRTASTARAARASALPVVGRP
jgi:hypothetical protein